jgi:DNA-binding NarL/FixJ family response regulator
MPYAPATMPPESFHVMDGVRQTKKNMDARYKQAHANDNKKDNNKAKKMAIKLLRLQGKTYEQIAVELEMNVKSIAYWLKKK